MRCAGSCSSFAAVTGPRSTTNAPIRRCRSWMPSEPASCERCFSDRGPGPERAAPARVINCPWAATKPRFTAANRNGPPRGTEPLRELTTELGSENSARQVSAAFEPIRVGPLGCTREWSDQGSVVETNRASSRSWSEMPFDQRLLASADLEAAVAVENLPVDPCTPVGEKKVYEIRGVVGGAETPCRCGADA
jgi:hypothetical protein